MFWTKPGHPLLDHGEVRFYVLDEAGSGFVPKNIGTTPGRVIDFNINHNMYYYVYILKSLANPERHYVGRTANLEKRLKRHNNGEVRYTSVFRPWQIETAIAFTSRSKAFAFEKYLKSHSGRAFGKKHF
jgi:predicted GIY-YIG superfamily endonuclease